ncbi:MAG: hypothetical protein ABSC20_00660 [Candidatus Bathyarchaeia archaeon]|jgi:hypothetical protein
MSNQEAYQRKEKVIEEACKREEKPFVSRFDIAQERYKLNNKAVMEKATEKELIVLELVKQKRKQKIKALLGKEKKQYFGISFKQFEKACIWNGHGYGKWQIHATFKNGLDTKVWEEKMQLNYPKIWEAWITRLNHNRMEQLKQKEANRKPSVFSKLPMFR